MIHASDDLIKPCHLSRRLEAFFSERNIFILKLIARFASITGQGPELDLAPEHSFLVRETGRGCKSHSGHTCFLVCYLLIFFCWFGLTTFEMAI